MKIHLIAAQWICNLLRHGCSAVIVLGVATLLACSDAAKQSAGNQAGNSQLPTTTPEVTIASSADIILAAGPSVSFTASGGTPPYVWSVTNVNPESTALARVGQNTGELLPLGVGNVVVTATDSGSFSGSKTVTIYAAVVSSVLPAILDSKLRQCIDDYITENMLDESDPPLDLITTLDYTCAYRDIKDLTGIGYFFNLEELNLGHNGITDLAPLQLLKHLSVLDLSSNVNLQSYQTLNTMGALTSLLVRENNITDLSVFSGILSLTHLFLDTNHITDLRPLSSLTKLIKIDASSNQIVDPSGLDSLPNLGLLDLGFNKIVDVTPIATLPKINALYLKNNPIGGLNIGNIDTITLNANPAESVYALEIDLSADLGVSCEELTALIAKYEPGTVVGEDLDGISIPITVAVPGTNCTNP